MALPSHMYRDPLEQLLNAERRSCNGCRFLIEAVAFGQSVQVCRLQRKKIRKCSMYAEKG